MRLRRPAALAAPPALRSRPPVTKRTADALERLTRREPDDVLGRPVRRPVVLEEQLPARRPFAFAPIAHPQIISPSGFLATAKSARASTRLPRLPLA